MITMFRAFSRLAVSLLGLAMFIPAIVNQMWVTTPSARRRDSTVDTANNVETIDGVANVTTNTDTLGTIDGRFTVDDAMCLNPSREAFTAAGEELVDQVLQQARTAPRRLTETQMSLLSFMLFEDGATHVYGLSRALGIQEETTRAAMVALTKLGFVERATEADAEGRYPYRLVSEKPVYEAIIAEQDRRHAEVTREMAKLLKKLEEEEPVSQRRKTGASGIYRSSLTSAPASHS